MPPPDSHMIKEEYPQHQYHRYPDPGYHNEHVSHVREKVTQNMTHQHGVISEEEAEEMTEAGLLPLQPLSSQPQPVAMEAAKPRTVFIR